MNAYLGSLLEVALQVGCVPRSWDQLSVLVSEFVCSVTQDGGDKESIGQLSVLVSSCPGSDGVAASSSKSNCSTILRELVRGSKDSTPRLGSPILTELPLDPVT
ncbi:hypothetical protein Nepgr_033133 [Nepenthes gracilis]|uniref:Uncharacterized protein n=1 Tax=Nepenthes gracilis TaxID=150966 RepID=A0AAD3Y858_NEPGR|nr:hypothetical protein Nepgr_033133 [Nepenthes gracilis]